MITKLCKTTKVLRKFTSGSFCTMVKRQEMKDPLIVQFDTGNILKEMQKKNNKHSFNRQLPQRINEIEQRPILNKELFANKHYTEHINGNAVKETQKKKQRKRCLLLPGMGVEYPGMCKDLVRDFPYITSFLKDCDDLLNLPLSKMMFEGHPDELSQPLYAGNATFVATVAVWRILQKEYDIDSILSDEDVSIIGHSMGEYVALELTKAYQRFEDALFISNLISDCCRKYGGIDQGMYAIKCKSEHKLDMEWLSDAIDKHNLYFANINAPNQVIISGLKRDIECMVNDLGFDNYRECDGLRGAFISPKGAFHSPLILPGLPELHEKWHSIPLNDVLRYDLYLNVIGDKYDVKQGHNITDIMKTQLYTQVKFYECISNYIKRNDVDNEEETEWDFIQIGPRNVLQKMVKDIVKHHGYDQEKNLNIFSVNSSKSIRDMRAIL